MKNRTAVHLSLAILAAMLSGCATLANAGFGGGSLANDLDRIFDDPATARGQWGVLIRSLDDGRTVYARNADRLFLPASNNKLISGAAILETLTPEYRWTTTISTSGMIVNGALEGSLVVTGTGDPTFGQRFRKEDPRAVFREWADSLRAHGITRIAGGIIAVDSAFSGPVYGEGWMWDDFLGSASAPYAALQFNDNVLSVSLYPSATVLQPAIVVVTPPTQAMRVVNDTRTMPEGSNTAVRFVRDENGSGIIVRGEVAADAREIRRTIAVTDPVGYFATVLRETLREAGIAVEGAAFRMSDLDPYDPTIPNALTLFTHHSPPLREVLPEMMKPSQNQIAESMFITVGREVSGDGTADGALAAVDSLVRAWGIDPAGLRMVDGSGLSRYNLVSPGFFVDLLTHMDSSPWRELWIQSMPIAGRDGTLEDRMLEPPLLDHVHAKTGTISTVRTLSGYLTAQDGERYVFSILSNHTLAGSSRVDRVAEAALLRIAID